jgi:mRNA-degrading endonuclease RelE of RelBE toxin-antitoxin system
MRYVNGVPSDPIEVIQTKTFSRQIDDLLSPSGYEELEWHLSCRPDAGPVIPASGGLRKLKWKAEGRGKRGGVRVIYYWHKGPSLILMLVAFGKNERSDLSKAELRAVRKAVEAEFGG